jgi:fucose 4-O-acetylase-like acetyltransferase
MSSAVALEFPIAQQTSAVASQERVDWIDIARGVVILLVVLGHAGLFQPLHGLFVPFRMPFFYITAGYIFNYPRHRHALLRYSGQRSRRLASPYFCTALIFYAVILTTDRMGWTSEGLIPGNQLMAILMGNSAAMPHQWGYQLGFDIPLWFLSCLTMASLLFAGLLDLFRHAKNEMALILASLVVASAGRIIGVFVFLPWGLDIAMMAQCFLVIGFLLRRHEVQFNNRRAAVILGLVYLAFCLSKPNVDMNNRVYPNIIAFYAAALGGSYLVFYFSRQWARRARQSLLAHRLAEPWRFLGRHTMVIMLFHWGGIYVQQIVQRCLAEPRFAQADSHGLPLFLWMLATSLLAIAVINGFEPLRKIYYKS